MCTMSVGICKTKYWQSWNNIIICHFTKKRVWCNWPCKSSWMQMTKSLISHFSYITGLWIWGENWTLGALGSGEGKSTPCQSNPQSRAVRGGVFGRRARWPAQTSSRPTWWTPSGSAPLPDTATPGTRVLVVPAVWETEREGEDWWSVKKECGGKLMPKGKYGKKSKSGWETDGCCISTQIQSLMYSRNWDGQKYSAENVKLKKWILMKKSTIFYKTKLHGGMIKALLITCVALESRSRILSLINLISGVML